MKNEIKTNTTRTFLTNDELYHLFSLKCRENKQKIGDRINLLIATDLGISISTKIKPVNQSLFENTEINSTPKEASDEVA